MEKTKKEEIQQNTKTKFNFTTILLIIFIVIILCLIAAVIVLAVKLHKKNNDYDDLEEKYNILKNNNNMTNSTYSKQNDSLNDIFNVFQKFIQDTEIINPKISRDNYRNVKDNVISSRDLTDWTYDFVTKEELFYNTGYQVSFETDSRNYESGYYTDEEYDELVYKLASLFNVNASLGVYETIPEISYHINDKNTSLAIAALFNQISVWDWENNYELLNDFHQDKYF